MMRLALAIIDRAVWLLYAPLVAWYRLWASAIQAVHFVWLVCEGYSARDALALVAEATQRAYEAADRELSEDERV